MGNENRNQNEINGFPALFQWIRQPEFENINNNGDQLNVYDIWNNHEETWLTNGGGDIPHPDRVFFRRMRQVYIYEEAVALQEEYILTREHLQQQLEGRRMAATGANTPEDGEQEENFIDQGRPELFYDSTWYLDSSYSPTENQPSPSSTDSEVHVSTTTSNDTVMENSTIIRGVIDPLDMSLENHEILPDNNSSLNILNNENETDIENAFLERIQNNILLHACLLDVNDVPFSSNVVSVVRDLTSQLFDESDAEVVNHFMQYRMRVALNDIRSALADLNLQYTEAIDSMNNNRLYSSYSPNLDESTQAQIFTNTFETDVDTFSPNLSSDFEAEVEIPEWSFDSEDESDDTLIQHFSFDERLENDTEATNEMWNDSPIRHSTSSESVDGPVDEPSNSSTNVEVKNKDIVINTDMWTSEGYTKRVMDILKELLPLSSIKRRIRLYRYHVNALTPQERQVLAEFLKLPAGSYEEGGSEEVQCGARSCCGIPIPRCFAFLFKRKR